MLCSMVLNGLVRSLRVLKFDVGDEFNMITLSIDPGEGPELAHEKHKGYREALQASRCRGRLAFLDGRRVADPTGCRCSWFPLRLRCGDG